MLFFLRHPQTEKGIKRRYNESWQRPSSDQGLHLNTGHVASDEFSEHPCSWLYTYQSTLLRTTAVGVKRL